MEMKFLQQSFDTVTSLVDFYGFRDKRAMSPDSLLQAIRDAIGQYDERSVFPYVQVHEFEGLLFSERGRIRNATPRRAGRRTRIDSLRVQDAGGHQRQPRDRTEQTYRRTSPALRKGVAWPRDSAGDRTGQDPHRMPEISTLGCAVWSPSAILQARSPPMGATLSTCLVRPDDVGGHCSCVKAGKSDYDY